MKEYMNIDMKIFPFANRSQMRRKDAKMLVLLPEENSIKHLKMKESISCFRKGDLVVVNDSGTLPASFKGIHRESGKAVELRLAYSLSDNPKDISHWMAVIFGEGDWRMRTEDRPSGPETKVGEHLDFDGLTVRVHKISPISNRFLEIKFLEDPQKLWQKIYHVGKPIQYAHLTENLELWDQQTIFSGPPVSVEPSSASFQLSWEMVLSLKQNGVNIVPITHAIGLSSAGDTEIDNKLPLPERYWISNESASMINNAKNSGKRIIALGTSVTRALESVVINNGNNITPGMGVSDLKITASHQRKLVSGIFSGLHTSEECHIRLLSSFAPLPMLEKSYREAIERGYLWHEYGDACLIINEI